jgi:hypothetical protein
MRERDRDNEDVHACDLGLCALQQSTTMSVTTFTFCISIMIMTNKEQTQAT